MVPSGSLGLQPGTCLRPDWRSFPQRWLFSGSGGTPFGSCPPHPIHSQQPGRLLTPPLLDDQTTLWNMRFGVQANENEHHLLATQQTLHVFAEKVCFYSPIRIWFLISYSVPVWKIKHPREHERSWEFSSRYLINAKAKPSHIHFHIMIMLMMMMMPFTYLFEIKKNNDNTFFCCNCNYHFFALLLQIHFLFHSITIKMCLVKYQSFCLPNKHLIQIFIHFFDFG